MSNIELFLNDRVRLMNRQLMTRKNRHKDILGQVLKNYWLITFNRRNPKPSDRLQIGYRRAQLNCLQIISKN